MQGEGDRAHLGLGLHARGEEGGHVGGAPAKMGAKAAQLLDAMRRHPGRGELRENQPTMIDDLGQARLVDYARYLLGAPEVALAGGAPRR